MTSTQLCRLLTGGRFLVGGGALVMPSATGRIVGIDARNNPAALFVGRLFGVRAVLMAVLVLGAEGEERKRQLRAGLVVDLVDALTALIAAGQHQVRPRTAAAACAAALTEVALGLRLLGEEDHRHGSVNAGRELSRW